MRYVQHCISNFQQVHPYTKYQNIYLLLYKLLHYQLPISRNNSHVANY